MQNLWVHHGCKWSVAVMLTGVALFSVVQAAPPSPLTSEAKAKAKAKAPTLSRAAVEAEVASEEPSLTDPMEWVREKLNSRLTVPDNPVKPLAEAQSEDPESLAMERLRARLAKRLGVEAQVTPSNELRLTTRIASPSEVEAARLVANSPAQRRDAGGAGKPSGGRHQAATNPVAEAPPQSGQPWAYEGPNGPKAWPRLKPEYAACGSGKRQSPIDIRDGIRLNLEPVVFEYSATPVKVLDDGRSLQALPGPGNTVVLRGRRYELRLVQFHTPAEDQVQGIVHDMSVSLVHQDSQGRWLVLSLLFNRGLSQPVLQTVLDNLPLEKGDDVQISQPLDWRALLPTDRSYYIYMGSLSTPPCTEGVVRIVMKTSMMLSPEQLAIFTRLYPTTARPVQLSMGRVVKESN